VIDSYDGEAEANSQAISAGELDGLVLPGGLATWMIRGHPGLKRLICEMDAAGKPVSAVGRGVKLLLSAGVLDGRTVTCAPEMRDDLIYAVDGIDCREDEVVVDGNMVTCQGTEDLPAFMRALIALQETS
jgi:protease I